MADMINRKMFKEALLRKAEEEGKRIVDKDGNYVKGINRIPSSMYTAAAAEVYAYINRAVSMAHNTKPTIDLPMSKAELIAAGVGPRKRKR